ncbi:MAG: GntR family transcriptional regulator [Microbacterium sp.]
MPVTLYRRIGSVLRHRVASGEYGAGQRMPSEESLCAEFEVSRSTIRKSLDELVAAGLIVRHRGRGTHVAPGVTPAVLESIVCPTFVSVRSSHVHKLCAVEFIRAGNSDLELPGIDPDVTMLRVSREKRDASGRLLLRETNMLPPQLASRLDLGRRHHDWTVLELLLKVGLPVSLMNITVEPMVLDGEAAHFDAEAGTPTFRYVSRFWSAAGRIVAATGIVYRPDYYRLTVDLSVSDQLVHSGDLSLQSEPIAREALRSRALSNGYRDEDEGGCTCSTMH